MGMRQADMIGIVGKTHDAVQAQQTNVRGHDIVQDKLAIKQTAEAEHASEQVSATAPEDRIDLSAEWQGGAGGGGDEGGGKSKTKSETPEEQPTDEKSGEHHIDFMA